MYSMYTCNPLLNRRLKHPLRSVSGPRAKTGGGSRQRWYIYTHTRTNTDIYIAQLDSCWDQVHASTQLNAISARTQRAKTEDRRRFAP